MANHTVWGGSSYDFVTQYGLTSTCLTYLIVKWQDRIEALAGWGRFWFVNDGGAHQNNDVVFVHKYAKAFAIHPLLFRIKYSTTAHSRLYRGVRTNQLTTTSLTFGSTPPIVLGAWTPRTSVAWKPLFISVDTRPLRVVAYIICPERFKEEHSSNTSSTTAVVSQTLALCLGGVSLWQHSCVTSSLHSGVEPPSSWSIATEWVRNE